MPNTTPSAAKRVALFGLGGTIASLPTEVHSDGVVPSIEASALVPELVPVGPRDAGAFARHDRRRSRNRSLPLRYFGGASFRLQVDQRGAVDTVQPTDSQHIA